MTLEQGDFRLLYTVLQLVHASVFLPGQLQEFVTASHQRVHFCSRKLERYPLNKAFFQDICLFNRYTEQKTHTRVTKLMSNCSGIFPLLPHPPPPICVCFFFFVFCLLFLLLKHNWLLKSMYIDYYFLGDEEHIEISSERKDKWF